MMRVRLLLLLTLVASPSLGDPLEGSREKSGGEEDALTVDNTELVEELYNLAEDPEASSHVPIWQSSSDPEEAGGYTTSTIYAFSYENLLIILAVKAVVIFLLFGSVGFLGRSTSSSLEPEYLVDRSDLSFALAFLRGQVSGDYNCLQRLVCLDRSKAELIVRAARLLESGIRLIESLTDVDVAEEKFLPLRRMEDTLEDEESSCEDKYSCDAPVH